MLDVHAKYGKKDENGEIPAGKKSRWSRSQDETKLIDQSEPAASSSLSEEERSAVSRLVKMMALLCSVHDVDFRNLVKDHILDVGEHLN